VSYDPAIALDFFKSAGKPTSVAGSSVIFAQKESGKRLFSSQRSKIYLLLAGEVTLLAGDKPIGAVKIGEIFGELAAITHAPRVAISIGGRVVERLGPGGAFGEAALFDQSPRLATALAETDCELQPINRTAFLTLVKVSPQFAYSMLSSLAERLRFLTARL
jgi:CRP-like cAMP-binding protein